LWTIRYQQRGTFPSDTGPPYAIEAHVVDAVAVLEFFGLAQAWAIGHSWGGHLALHLAVTHGTSARGCMHRRDRCIERRLRRARPASASFVDRDGGAHPGSAGRDDPPVRALPLARAPGRAAATSEEAAQALMPDR